MSVRTEVIYFGCGPAVRRQPLFAQLHGVTGTRVGYMGGWTARPSATQIASNMTGHTEVVEVTFDTNATKLTAILKAFFSFHDATVDRGADGGPYGSAVFCRKAKHHVVVDRAIALLRKHDLAVTTHVKDAQMFWEADAGVTSLSPSRPRAATASQTVSPESSTPSGANPLRCLTLVEAASLKPAQARELILAG